MGKAELDIVWDDLRSELLYTGDPRKKLLVDVVDGVMELYRARLSITNGHGPKDNDIDICDDCSANAI